MRCERERCGKDFTPSRKGHRFCSDACRNARDPRSISSGAVTAKLEIHEIGRLAEVLSKHRLIDLGDGTFEGWIRYHLERDATKLGFVSLPAKSLPSVRPGAWDLGAQIRQVYESRSYFQTHPSFEEWCRGRGLTYQHAFRLIDVAKHFTRDEVAEVGVTKLDLILRLGDALEDPETRRSAVDMARREPVAKVRAFVLGLAPKATGRRVTHRWKAAA